MMGDIIIYNNNNKAFAINVCMRMNSRHWTGFISIRNKPFCGQDGVPLTPFSQLSVGS